MKVAVVGCGALGSYYGAQLCRAGHDVHFLLRSDYEVVRREGVQIRSPRGDFTARPHAALQPEEIGPSDLVLIGLKTTANDQFPVLLPPLVGPHTAVLTLQNGLGNEEALADLFPISQIMGGLAFVCLNRLAPGLVHHLDHGRIVIGEFRRGSEPRTHRMAEAFRAATVPCDVTEDLARSHWEKLVWNIPFNGLGVASSAGYEAVANGRVIQPPGTFACLTTDQLLADSKWELLVRELMLEVIAAGRAVGHQIPERIAEENMARTRTMGAYKPSTLVDFERGQPLELDSLFVEPLRQAQQTGTGTPRLLALVTVLARCAESVRPG